MLREFDERLFSKAERFSHRWQRTTGLTNFWLARLCSWLYALHITALLVMIVVMPGKFSVATRLILITLYSFLSLGHLHVRQLTSVLYREMEDYYLSSGGVAHLLTLLWRKSWRHRTTSIRWMLCWLCCLSPIVLVLKSGWLLVFVVIGVVGDIALLGEMYFRTVIPLPPGQSKVRQLLDDWSIRWTALVPAHQENS